MNNKKFTHPPKKSKSETVVKELCRRYAMAYSPTLIPLLFEGFGDSAFETLPESSLMKVAEERIRKLKAQWEEQQRKEREREESQAKSEQRAMQPLKAGEVRLRNSRSLMALPFFSPDRKTRFTPSSYTSADGTQTLEIAPNSKFGQAKVWDGDLLMYALSKGWRSYRETGAFPTKVRFSVYEYLKHSGKKTNNGKSHKNIRGSLCRLTSTHYILTDIPKRTENGFVLCGYELVDDEGGNPCALEITFSHELFKFFISRSDLIALKDGLLLDSWNEENSGLRKRLIVLVGTHIGEQSEWKVRLSQLRAMCGHAGQIREFRRMLKGIAPSLRWKMSVSRGAADDEIVTFTANH